MCETVSIKQEDIFIDNWIAAEKMLEEAIEKSYQEDVRLKDCLDIVNSAENILIALNIENPEKFEIPICKLIAVKENITNNWKVIRTLKTNNPSVIFFQVYYKES